jgi:hypothetical protein
MFQGVHLRQAGIGCGKRLTSARILAGTVVDGGHAVRGLEVCVRPKVAGCLCYFVKGGDSTKTLLGGAAGAPQHKQCAGARGRINLTAHQLTCSIGCGCVTAGVDLDDGELKQRVDRHRLVLTVR